MYVDRIAATERTLKKYRDKPFQWGRNDCITAVRTQLLNMGHKPPQVPRYSSYKTALRRLEGLGHESLESLLSEYCTEIPPAWMLPGDLATVPGEGRLSAVAICVGSKFMGYPSEHPYFSVVDLKPVRAWRV